MLVLPNCLRHREDRILPLLLLYNASEAFLRIRWANSLEEAPKGIEVPVGAARKSGSTTTSTASPQTGQQSSTPSRSMPITIATYKSSPKTRPSSYALSSSSGLSSSPLKGSTDSTRPHQTNGSASLPPSSAAQSTPPRFFRGDLGSSESPTAALRRALLESAGPNHQSTPQYGVGSNGTIPATSTIWTSNPHNSTPVKQHTSPRVQAYRTRHESLACECDSLSRAQYGMCGARTKDILVLQAHPTCCSLSLSLSFSRPKLQHPRERRRRPAAGLR